MRLGTIYFEQFELKPSRDRGCTCTTAEYTLREDNTLRILNTCRLNSVTSGLYQREANGRAVGEGKLKINVCVMRVESYVLLDLVHRDLPNSALPCLASPHRSTHSSLLD